MFKGSIWRCDECGKETMVDGFPKEWFDIKIRKGDIFSEEEGDLLLDVDCCSEDCANTALVKYINSKMQKICRTRYYVTSNS